MTDEHGAETPGKGSLRPDIQAGALELNDDPDEGPTEHQQPSLRQRADAEEEPS